MATAAPRSTLTPQQRQAIETRDVGVALSAGAGCGKTFVLTQRYLSHLEPHGKTDASSQLGRLIAITFTERAAREMRQRIRSAVRDRLMQCEPAEEKHWLEILRRLDTAKISTIHSFCGSLLRAHAVEAGLDPRFSVLEPTGADVLLGELIDDRLRELLATGDADMIELTAGYDLRGVRERIGKLLAERFHLRFEDWLPLAPMQLVAKWQAFHNDKIRPRALARFREEPAVRKLLDEVLPQGAPQEKLAERAAIVQEILARIRHEEPTELDLASLRENATVQGCSAKKAWAGHEELYEDYKTCFAELRGAVDALREQFTFDAQAARTAAEAALRFVRVAAPVRAHYEERKRSLGVLDFDDLLLKAHALLTDPNSKSLRERLARQTELLLVDECQDTDSLQVELILALCGGHKGREKLFHVGDSKQSIYRFRGAQPSVFQALRDETPSKGRLPLSLNFRSEPAILDFVNGLFGEMFAEYEPLHARRAQASPTPAVEFLWATAAEAKGDRNASDNGDDETGGGDDASVHQLRLIEADWIARYIRGMIDRGEPIVPGEKNAGGLRPARFGDFALLFRALSNVGLYEAALERYGVPYYVVGGKAFYAQQEVYDLLNFLKTLDSTCDDIALAGVLRSPFFSLADETLFHLAQHDDGLAGGLFAPSLADDLMGEELRRASFAARTIRELRELKDRLPIAELVQEILARTSYDAIVTAEFLGDRKLANLRKLVDMARGFDRSGIFTLAAFIEQLSTSVVEQPDEAPAAAFAEGADVVRLMSIHQSKGLEFPIVFVPDLERKRQHNRAGIAFDSELGPVVGAPYGEKLPSGIDLYRQIENEQDEAESRRLFYVAVTRAADRLILSSGVNDAAEPRGEWRKVLAERFDLVTGAFLGRVLDGCGRPDVRVVTERPEVDEGSIAKRTRPDWQKMLQQVERQRKAGATQLLPGTEPIEWISTARRRFSFSRISGDLLTETKADEERELATEAALAGELDARMRGIVAHDVLAAWDYTTSSTRRAATIDALVRRHARGAQQYVEADVADLAALVDGFLRSPRGAEVAQARAVHRESEFLLSWPLGKAAADGIYFQGFIDLLYQAGDDRWHVVDYKSHLVAGDDVTTTAAPYKLQLAVYALAVEEILGRPPDELTLFFLRGGREFSLAWTKQERERTIATVNRQLAAALTQSEKR